MSLKKAVKVAKAIPYKKHKQRVVALAYNKTGKLIAIGRNEYVKSHPIQAAFAKKAGFPQRIYLHAEIDAIIKAKGQANKLVICRINKYGEPLPSLPCPVCALAILKSKIKYVEYVK